MAAIPCISEQIVPITRQNFDSSSLHNPFLSSHLELKALALMDRPFAMSKSSNLSKEMRQRMNIEDSLILLSGLVDLHTKVLQQCHFGGSGAMVSMFMR